MVRLFSSRSRMRSSSLFTSSGVCPAGIAKRSAGDAQVRALDALASHRLSDPESVAAIAARFPLAGSLEAQRAIAGILIRADTASLARDDLAKSLKRTRLRSPDGADMIDVLIRRLEAKS